MKKIFALTAIFALVFAACNEPENDNNPDPGSKLPSLTIKNESSFDLTNVKFSGISFSTPNSNDLLRTTQSVKQLTADDVNKTGYITFTRKDIGINCRTEAVSITDQDFTFTFLDTTVVEEQVNTNNKGTLGQIIFLSQVTIVRGGLSVAKNDSVNLGEIVINTPKENEFTLRNTGTGKLILTGNEPVKISNDSAGVFSVAQQPSSSEIAANGSLNFKINFTPKDAQTYNATVTINSNDKNSPFTFNITAVGSPGKSIAVVFYENNEISQNGTINADEAFITLSKSITVVIKNTGLEPLTIDIANITITGTDLSAFTKTTNPGGSVSAGGQTSFIIDCKPVKQGENNAVLTIPTNDGSRNPITIYLKIIGVKGSAILQLTQGTTVITNNTLTPVDFGKVDLGTEKSLVFIVKNTGNINLELTGNPIVESSNAVFSVSTQPAIKTLIPEDTTSFNIKYTPTSEVEDTAAITITNNSETLVFTLNVKGTGYVKKPQINIQQGTSTIALHSDYDFGTIASGKTKDIVFTIRNSGDANLNFITENNSRINIVDNGSGFFSVTQQPSVSTVVTPENTTTFTVRFDPAMAGVNFTATVLIKTNSRENDVFSFRIKGTARAASTEARLSGLQFNKGKLDQQFNPNINNYTLKIDTGQTLVNVTPTSTDANISDIKVNGTSQNSGVMSQDIILASNSTVIVVVTAEDGTTTSTYTVTINRIVNYSSTALSNFYVSNMDETDTENVLDILDSNNKLYWLALPDETQLKFKVTPVNSNATVKINNNTITNNVYTSGNTLNSGSAVTTFTVTIVSEDGENSKIITIESSYLGSQWERVGYLPSELAEYPYEHTVIVHNNQFIMTNSWEVWTSSNGTNWNWRYDFPYEIDHWRCSTVLFNNTIYNIGGWKETTPDNWEIAPVVSYSTNGVNWTTPPSITGLTNGIIQHTSVVFNGAIYTMGGETKIADQTNAVWRSTNGTTWTQQTAPSWGARAGHAGVVYDNKIFVIGGYYNDGNSEYRDVWSSTNGTTWTQETASAAWTGRNDHTVNANSKGMWLVGGNDGSFKRDVWFSRDGKTWTQVLQNAPFAERASHAAAIKDGYLYIFGGVNRSWDNPYYTDDIWRTYIGE
jgi:hypothetical protein